MGGTKGGGFSGQTSRTTRDGVLPKTRRGNLGINEGGG